MPTTGSTATGKKNIFPLFDNSNATRAKEIFTPDTSVVCDLPLFMEPVSAGFPSPAGDYMEGKLDLNRHLIRHPAATFFVRVTGDSMIGAGIHSGDLLIVDRAIEPADGKVVVVALDGELTVKRLSMRNGCVMLLPENERYLPIAITSEHQFEIWGVVTNVIHPL